MARPLDDRVGQQLARWRRERARDLQCVGTTSPFVVTLAHDVGSGGAEIAAGVAERLGVPLLEREIVDHMARTVQVRLEAVETLPDEARGRVEEYVASLMRSRSVMQDEYLGILAQTVTALWEHGPCVLVGHGCVHVVPRTHALAVRVVAPAALRIQRVADRHGWSPADAAVRVGRIDSERAAFHRLYFGCRIEDPLNYDLTIDASGLGARAAAATVADAYLAKFGAANG